MVPQSCKHSILEPDMNFCELMFNLDYTVKNFLKHKTKQRNSEPEKHKQTSLPKKLKSKQNIREKTKNIIISYLCIQT